MPEITIPYTHSRVNSVPTAHTRESKKGRELTSSSFLKSSSYRGVYNPLRGDKNDFLSIDPNKEALDKLKRDLEKLDREIGIAPASKVQTKREFSFSA